MCEECVTGIRHARMWDANVTSLSILQSSATIPEADALKSCTTIAAYFLQRDVHVEVISDEADDEGRLRFHYAEGAGDGKPAYWVGKTTAGVFTSVVFEEAAENDAPVATGVATRT